MQAAARAEYAPFSYRARPVWSLFGIAFGAALSYLLIPSGSFSAPGALWLPALVLSIGILFGPILAAAGSPASIFRAEHVLMFGLVYWVLFDSIQGAYPLVGVSRDGVIGIFMGVALFAAALWIGSCTHVVTRGNKPYPPPNEIGPRFLLVGAILAFSLGSLRVFWACQLSIGCVASSFFQPRLTAEWLTPDIFGTWDTLFQNLAFFGYLVLPMAAALLHAERRLSWRFWLVTFLGLLFLLLLIQSGGRRHVGVVLGATVFVWLLLEYRIRWTHLLSLGFVLLCMLVLMQAMVAWRDIGIATAISEGRDLQIPGRSGLVIDKNFSRLGLVITAVPEQHPHTGLTGVLYAVTAPIPRSIFPMKPRNPAATLLPALGLRARPGWSWTLSAVGDLYMIGGFIVIAAGGFIYGVLASMATSLLYAERSIRSRLVFAVAAFVLFVALRSITELSGMGLMLAALWALLALRRALLRRRQLPNTNPVS